MMKETDLRCFVATIVNPGGSKTWGFALLTAILSYLVCHLTVRAQSEPAADKGTQTHLSRAELQIWRSPAFRKRLAESYLSETDIEPSLTEDERDTITDFQKLMQADKVPDAESKLQRARNDAASAAIDFYLGNLYFGQERFAEAAATYQVAIEKFPKFRRAWQNLGKVYALQEDYASAVPALTRVIELGGGDPDVFGLLGMAYLTLEDYLASESAFRMAILLDPQEVRLRMGLAQALFKQERFAESASLCAALSQRFPDDTKYWLLQAKAYAYMGQTQRAAELFELVDHLGGSTADNLKLVGDIYVNDELYDLAIRYYKKALESDREKSVDGIIASARAMAHRGAISQTREVVDQIEQMFGEELGDSRRIELLKLRSRIALAEGSPDEEAEILEEIVRLDPLDGHALILLGQYSGRNGEVAKAVMYFERAARLPEHEADANLRHAELLVRSHKYNEALPLLRRAQKVKPRNSVQDFLEDIERFARNR